MKLVIDANILFSALIKNSTSRIFILNSNLELFSPDFLQEELNKYNKYILKKTLLEIDKFELLKKILLKNVRIISKKEYNKHMDIAKILTPDIKDIAYFALALKLKCPIWSNDKKLKEQNKIKIFSTNDLLKASI